MGEFERKTDKEQRALSNKPGRVSRGRELWAGWREGGWRCCLADIYVFWLLTLFPLLCRSYSGLTALKTRSFCFSALALLALLVLSLLREKPRQCGRIGERPAAVAPLAALALFTLLALVSALASPFGADAWLGQGRGGGWLLLALYVALLAVCAVWSRPRAAYLWAGGAALLLMEALALLQLAGFDPLGLYPGGWNYYDAGTHYQGVFLSTLGNSGQLAAWLSLALPPLLLYGLSGGSKRRLLLLPAGLGLLLMALAQLEGALLGLGLGLLLLLPWLLGRSRRARWLLGGGVMLLLGLTLLALYHYPGPQQGTLWEAAQILRGQGQASFGSYRLGIWRSALELAGQRPWLGWGPDCFADAYAALFSGPMMRVDAAHNEYLHMAVCLGWPALLAYGAAFLATLALLLKKGVKERRLLIYAASLLCYSVQAFFNFSTPISAPLLWAVWGMSLRELSLIRR